MFYYSSSLLWPTMISVFYLPDPTDWRAASILSLVQGFAICTGVLFLSLFGSRIKHWNWQLAGYTFVMVLFGVLLALGNPGNRTLMIVCVFISQAAYGPAIYLAIAISQMGVEKRDLGLSGGVSGTCRFAGGAIATSVYTAVLSNTVKKWTMRLVPIAVVKAGLPLGEVGELMARIRSGELSRYDAGVVAAVGKASQKAYEHGIQ
jgi:hypothetical protein